MKPAGLPNGGSRLSTVSPVRSRNPGRGQLQRHAFHRRGDLLQVHQHARVRDIRQRSTRGSHSARRAGSVTFASPPGSLSVDLVRDQAASDERFIAILASTDAQRRNLRRHERSCHQRTRGGAAADEGAREATVRSSRSPSPIGGRRCRRRRTHRERRSRCPLREPPATASPWPARRCVGRDSIEDTFGRRQRSVPCRSVRFSTMTSSPTWGLCINESTGWPPSVMPLPTTFATMSGARRFRRAWRSPTARRRARASQHRQRLTRGGASWRSPRQARVARLASIALAVPSCRRS